MRLQLPALKPFDYKSVKDSGTLIVATGFEHRALNVMRILKAKRRQFSAAIVIDYDPDHPGNKVSETRKLAEELTKSKSDVISLTYTRFEPDYFIDQLEDTLDAMGPLEDAVVDISAMSKFLILIALNTLLDSCKRVTVTYSEAKEYFPTKGEFAKFIRKAHYAPDFLTTGVYKIVSSYRLSSIGMNDAPSLLVTFPTFNRSDIAAILNELPVRDMVLLYGVPHLAKNRWRLQALKTVNQGLDEYVRASREVSTFDYRDSLESLIEVAREYESKAQVIVSPTGSKLQTVGVALFRQCFPETQFIYPPTMQFQGKLSDGNLATWMIPFGDARAILRNLQGLRKQTLTGHIESAITTASKSYTTA